MELSSGKQSKTTGTIQAKRLEAGLFSVVDAYDGAYDFFASSVLFPDEARPNEDLRRPGVDRKK